MKILSVNNHYILASSQHKQCFLINIKDFKILYRNKFNTNDNFKVGSLQYGTGIVALALGSFVYIYDFIFGRETYSFDSYKNIQKLLIKKDLLIIVSQQRILIHNFHKKQNFCYIETINGKLSFFQQNYYRLCLFYCSFPSKCVSRQIWSKKTQNIIGVKYQNGCYYDNATKIVLALQNIISFYQQGQLIKVYAFDFRIMQLLQSEEHKLLFILLQNGQIISQNLKKQFNYEFTQILDHQFQKIDQHRKQQQNQKLYSIFWINQNNIFLWLKNENENGKLLTCSISNGKQSKNMQSFTPSQLSILPLMQQ